MRCICTVPILFLFTEIMTGYQRIIPPSLNSSVCSHHCHSFFLLLSHLADNLHTKTLAPNIHIRPPLKVFCSSFQPDEGPSFRVETSFLSNQSWLVCKPFLHLSFLFALAEKILSGKRLPASASNYHSHVDYAKQVQEIYDSRKIL